jgi:integrase
MNKPASQLPAALQALTARYANFSRADKTVRAYGGDWARYAAWCKENGLDPLPSAGDVVAAYCATLADEGKRKTTILRALASIARMHESAGHPSPWASPEVRVTMQGIARKIGAQERRVRPITPEQLHKMLEPLGQAPAEVRNKAILLVGFAGALRRSEIIGIHMEHLTFIPGRGVEVLLPRSKTDQEGKGQTVRIDAGGSLCPVAALNAWLDVLRAAGATSGPVFRSTHTRNMATRPKAITGGYIAKLIKTHCALAGIDPTEYSGHSLRAGCVTYARRLGRHDAAITKHTRHISLAMMYRYIRSDPWEDSLKLEV